MIILPTSTPVALTDFSQNNQSQQQLVQHAEQSKKATDTVQLSAQARELAGNKLAQNQAPLNPLQAADNEANEAVADNEQIEQQRPVNPLTQQPVNTKIDIIA